MCKLNKIEYEIANFLIQRKCPKYISAALHISYGTVRRNISNLRKLYDVHSTRELLAIFKSYKSENNSIKITPRDK